MYLIDTDICSFYLRGRFGLRERFERTGLGLLHISRVTVAELLVLAHKRPGTRITHETIRGLSRTLVFVEVDDAAWQIFSAVKARLQRMGRPSGDFDILLASVALTRDLTLVTNNEDHFRDTGVRMENWVAGLA